jgi:hypothetical protein
MHLPVHHKRGQRRLQAARRPSILGRGLLERARSTTLGLLGLTAAVGLSIVALALNQGWPLIPGSSIPNIGPKHEAIGDAAVAKAATAQVGGGTVAAATGQRSSNASSRPPRHAAGGTIAAPGSGPEGVAVSHPTPPVEGSAPNPASPPLTPPPDSQPATTPAPPSSSAAPAAGTAPPHTESSPAPQPVLASHDGGGHSHGNRSGKDASRISGHAPSGGRSSRSRSKAKAEPAPGPVATAPPPRQAEIPEGDPSRGESADPSGGGGGDHGRGHDQGHGSR